MNHPVRVLLIASQATADRIRTALLVPTRVDRLAPYELETTGSIAGAGESIRRDAPDILLLDSGLADPAAANPLAALRTAAPAVPIVVLASDHDASAALDALRNGAEDFLSREQLERGGIGRSLSYAIERSAAHEARAEERRLTGIGETALGLRHQINNPLAALLLNVELLKEGRRGDRKDAIMNIEIAAKQIAAVIRRIEGLRTPRSIVALGGDRMVDFSGSADAHFDDGQER